MDKFNAKMLGWDEFGDEFNQKDDTDLKNLKEFVCVECGEVSVERAGQICNDCYLDL